MKVGILYICTGKYDRFFEGFYESCEKNFLTNHEKTYYVWTDSEKEYFSKPNVVKFYQEKLGWPYDTMMRFQMFCEQKEALIKNHYLFFLNANMLIIDKVGDEVLPSRESGLVGVQHPSFFEAARNSFPYERRPSSSVSIPHDEGSFYFQGCFNGGGARSFLIMSRSLSRRISEDLSNGIVPLWHDESALNWYFWNLGNPKALSPSYAYPEGWNIPFEEKIIQIDKNGFGGHNFLRQ